ncbi:hypothetical protein Moror_11986 [Moniliophthora roreri MCA 2997]|uniref:NmrA-like domain-containing protein n=2 Tax=Moniliophthora roreri TaxID=221103 RepID=V2X2M3_MONRO|nr:hypothetical protein Moror_11986 [Moniliophthora roreri MCA 2997]KAI3599083.1 hypothetical protein WG66_004047 [Moniliophthora roreri]
MSTTSTTSLKAVLISGATGRQGHAAIAHLSKNNHFRILALTRNADSSSARELETDFPSIEIVEGDLNNPDSIRRIFDDEKEKEGTGIWGVFNVMAYPGLGVDATGEERAGKAIAIIAHEYAVSCFVYSSSERAGELYDDGAPPGSSYRAKVEIEKHLKELGNKGLNWTILRPVLFYENYIGQLGGTTFEVFKAGVKADTPVQLVAVNDIGRIIAGIFQDPEPYKHQILVPLSGNLTFAQQEEIFKEATGRSINNVPWPLSSLSGKGILKINRHTREMVEGRQKISDTIAEGKVPEFQSQVDLAKKALGPDAQWTSFEEWARKTKEDEKRAKNWNGISLSGILSGRS